MKNENGIEKSASLKGNTLVNLMTKCKDEYVVRYHDINNPNDIVANISMMKPNTEYTLFYKAKYRTEGDGSGTHGCLKIATSIEQGFIFTSQSYTTEYMKYVYRFTTSSVVDCFVFSSSGAYFAIKECVLLEGDYTNFDIPYFEGIQSVKNGKTLINSNNGVNSTKFYINSKSDFMRGVTVISKTNKTLIKPSTRYLLTFKVSELNLDGLSQVNLTINNNAEDSLFPNAKNFVITTNDTYKQIVTTNESANFNNHTFLIKGSGSEWEQTDSTSRTMVISDIMLIEYQDGMENWNIPYFEGMQSVKMPVLRTTGKNLFDISSMSNINNWDTNISEEIPYCSYKINLKPNTTYTFSQKQFLNIEGIYASFGLEKGIFEYLLAITHPTSQHPTTFTITTDDRGIIYLKLYKAPKILETFITGLSNNQLQLEESLIATSYEPYKTNILTVNEPIELRGIGNVKDELNLLTGELTERVGEYVFNGSEKFAIEEFVDNGTIYAKLISHHETASGIGDIVCNNFIGYKTSIYGKPFEGVYFIDGIKLMIKKDKLSEITSSGVAKFLSDTGTIVQYKKPTESIKTVDLTITDQDNQPQERMKLFPSGYINTSSPTFPPILELKGIAHNNKLNMTTTNGTNNTQLTTLDNLALDGIICRDGTVVRDSYDVESGLYTKRVFRATIDEEFINNYTWNITLPSNYQVVQFSRLNPLPKPYNVSSVIGNNIITAYAPDFTSVELATNNNIYIRIGKEELKSYDVNGLLDWIKRNGAIEIAYQMATPQIIHMQPNMQPYVSTRPYQGSIESQGNILESSFLDYTSEQSIISPKPLGDGDVLRWEQGSQCYVYENDKEYIPLTNYNQPMGTVLDLEEEDGEQFVENLDGGDIIVDVPFKEKAVYERHLVSHEDNVIYPTQDKLDPTGKIEVDYICGETWQNPNDLSDIRHVGTLREDGQYDVTIRRSGDDEIRLMDGITHLSLDGDGLNPSEFELTYYNKGGVEVGKYGDTNHALEDCVLDSKLETGTVYGDTLVNIDVDRNNPTLYGATLENDIVTLTTNHGILYKHKNFKPNTTYTLIITITKTTSTPNDYIYVDGYGNYIPTETVEIPNSVGTHKVLFTTRETFSDTSIRLFKIGKANSLSSSSISFSNNFIILEGDFTNYSMDIPYFEGVGSTIVNGFTTVGKNLFGFNDKYEVWNSLTKHEILDMNSIIVSPDTTSLNWINAGFYNYYLPHKTTDYFIISRKEEAINGNPYNLLNLYDADDNNQMVRIDVWEHDGYKYDLVQFRKDGERANIRFFCGSNTQMGTVKYSDIQITKYSQRPSRVNEEFEPYQSVQYTLPSPITLNKLGDVVDTYDVVSGVETRNVTELTFNGGENWDAMFNSSSSVFKLTLPSIKANSPLLIKNGLVDGITSIAFENNVLVIITTANFASVSVNNFKNKLKDNPITIYAQLTNAQTIQHTLIPSTVETMQEPTFILPQPLRSVPNGICDRLYWDENKGHYCIEKRVEELKIPLYDDSKTKLFSFSTAWIYRYTVNANAALFTNPTKLSNNITIRNIDSDYDVLIYSDKIDIYVGLTSSDVEANLVEDLTNRQRIVYYTLATSEIIDLPHLNKKLTLPTQPDTLPIGYKVECQKANPQLGLTIPYKQLNYPSRPQNIDFKMDIADYVLTWDDVKEARQYNVILNDRVIATVKEPQWNSGEEMYGYIMVEAQNELAENLSEELYIKTVPNAPAQLTVGHNPMTNYYDFEISFIKTSAIAEYYTVQYRIDNGEWVYKTIQSDEIDPNSKVLWKFSVYEINEQIEVWATATNEIGTNDILPTATYYMSPTPQWTYRINSKELFVRWMDDSPYDTQYKLRYQYKSDGIYRYAYFEGDKQEIGKLYEALIPLADDEEVSIALCVISEKENLYTKPIKASKELDPNIKPPKNFNYHWLARGLIEFYWEDNYDVDVEYEAIVEHRLTSGNNEWITDTRIFNATDTEGTGTVYRLSYQLEDLEEIRVKVRMKWAMNETEWTESLTTVFIPVEGNPPQWIRRTQTQEGLLVEWEAQEYVDSYHVYVMSNGEELQHLETMDNFIYVDLDYSNTIDIEIYEATRFSGGIESDPTDKMCFRPTMDKHQLIHDVVTPDTLTYEIEVDTIQKGIKERQQIHDINTTPNVKTKEPMDVAISSPFTLSFHPLQLDVHQSGSKYYGDTELHIKTLDVKSRDSIEVLTFERITDQYGVDFTVYTPSASKYPITLEVNRVRIVCFGDSKLKSVCRVIGIGHKFNC